MLAFAKFSLSLMHIPGNNSPQPLSPSLWVDEVLDLPMIESTILLYSVPPLCWATLNIWER